MRVSDKVHEAIDEFLFQRFGEKIYELDVRLLHHGAILNLITSSVNKTEKMEQVRTYEMKLELMDEEIHSIN